LAALPSGLPRWYAEALCESDTPRLYPVSTAIATVPAWEFLLCIDRSETATLSASALRALLSALVRELRPNDRLVIIQYRYTAESLCAVSGSELSPSALDTIPIVPPAGVAAPLHIVQGALEYCRQNPSQRPRAIFLLTESADHASFLTTADEVARTAQNLRIPILVLHCGMLGYRSFWRTLAIRTGGVYTWLSTAEPSLVIQKLVWTLRGLQTHYELSFPAPQPCKFLQLRLQAKELEATTSLLLEEPTIVEPLAKRYTICLFEAGDTTIAPLYEPSLRDLAYWLRAHPEDTIELIGHSSQHEASRDPARLGLHRAQAVRQRLLQLGAAPAQIRIRSEGNQQPQFYFEQRLAHQRANQRLEFRWLRPSELPYEILLGTEPSEEKARRTVELWQQRGYSAYYEPILQRGEPLYRIKLWGFATLQQARHTASLLRRRHALPARPW